MAIRPDTSLGDYIIRVFYYGWSVVLLVTMLSSCNGSENPQNPITTKNPKEDPTEIAVKQAIADTLANLHPHYQKISKLEYPTLLPSELERCLPSAVTGWKKEGNQSDLLGQNGKEFPHAMITYSQENKVIALELFDGKPFPLLLLNPQQVLSEMLFGQSDLQRVDVHGEPGAAESKNQGSHLVAVFANRFLLQIHSDQYVDAKTLKWFAEQIDFNKLLARDEGFNVPKP